MEAMKTIGNAMDIDTVEIERKINILLTQFRRVHKKVMTLKKNGRESEADRNLWYGYRLLTFLEDRFDSCVNKDLQVNIYLGSNFKVHVFSVSPVSSRRSPEV